MNSRSNHSRFGRQCGMGLIELMIGMTIGLIILAALGYFFLGSQQANRTHNDISRMQESGRQALEILGTAIRQAGYRTDADVAFAGTALNGTDGAPDTITVQFDAQEGNEPDCTGTTITAGSLVTYAFAVDDVDSELTCSDAGGTTVVVADNIEDMQITYGIDSNKDGVIESYKAAPTAAEFPQVAAVRVNLVVRGPTANAATGGDGFLRQTYASTFTVRNQAR
jgi:type IV pilus assembly protein PilW